MTSAICKVKRHTIALFVFHQANRMILETLRAKLDIDPSRFCIDLERVGNTSSSSIPAGVPASDDAHLVLDKGVIEHDHAAAGGEPGAEVRNFSRSDFVDARKVTPSLEWGLQPRVQNGEGLLGFQDPPPQGEHQK